jgi:hypothetical protein
MKHEGPILEVLLRRLLETSGEFLDPPRIGDKGNVHVAALVFDLSHAIGDACTLADLEPFHRCAAGDGNWLSICAIACWLLDDDCLRERLDKTALLDLLGQTLRAMAGEYAAGKYLSDPERREELVRIVLAGLALRPCGETPEQARDRLQALSSTERRRIIAAAKAAEKRAREIREALIAQAAAQAADKYTRE